MGKSRSCLLYPLASIYGSITGIKNYLYDSGFLHSTEFEIPVICTGNITAGGTGKTPLTEYLIRLLKDKFRVALLSRGYKRKTAGFQMATAGTTVSDLGDESFQIWQKFPDILVAVDNNRVNGVSSILQNNPDIQVVLMDDGFQHRRIKPGLSIVLIDYNRPLSKDHLLPYGNLRENKKNLRRADIIIFTKSPADITNENMKTALRGLGPSAGKNVFFTSITYGSPRPLFEGSIRHKLIPENLEHSNSGALLITGIASPEPLKRYLENFFGEIVHLNYPDHYNFRAGDYEKMRIAWEKMRSPVRYAITTEKDSVRLKYFSNIAEPLKRAFYYIPAGVAFLNGTNIEFDNLILEYAGKNKGNCGVSEKQRDKGS